MEVGKSFCLFFVVILVYSGAAQEKYSKVATGTLQRDTFTQDEEFRKWFLKGYESYAVNERIIDSLKSSLQGRSIVLVLGTWCSDSQEQVPAVLKILDNINFPAADIRFYGIDKEKKLPAEIVAQYKINSVPTIIVLQPNGTEVTRIVETPLKSLEEDLAIVR
jgi:thiol-disulfide isomerase/thioredoxin